MAVGLQSAREIGACWRQISTASFKDTPDERLKVYNALANLSGHGSEATSSLDMWTAAMLKAVQDPWSRIRKLGRERLLQDVVANAAKMNRDYAQLLPSLLVYKWPRLHFWYEREGLLLLLLGLVSCTPSVVSDRCVLAHVLIQVVLPSLSDPQLPVREVAIKITVQIARLSIELASFTLDYVFALLKECVEGAAEPEAFRVESFLSCFENILSVHAGLFLTRWWDKLQILLQQLAIHCAASVRQGVAGVWALHSPEAFAMLRIATIQKAQTPSESDDWWRMVEALLMALQEQLTHYLCFPDQVAALGLEARGSIADSLYAILLFAEAKQFEVSRMGKQLVPLITQFWVRFAHSLDFLEDCCGKTAVRFRERRHFSTLFLPGLLWFLALRRYVLPLAEVETLRSAVAQHVVPLLGGKLEDFLDPTAKGSKIKEESLSEAVRCSSRSDFSLPIILLCTYLPECCNDFGDTEMIEFALSEEAWERALSEDANNAKYAVDFALAVRNGGGTVTHLVPFWLQRFSGAYTHQQCLTLEAVKIAIGTPKLWEARKPFAFAYHSAFEAPTIQDGGDDVPLGIRWLKQHYPTHTSLPGITSVGLKEDNQVVKIPAILHDVVYKNMYALKGAEPSALHAVRSLMLVECEADPTRETIAAVVAAVVARLNNVAPSWRDAPAHSSGKNSDAPDMIQRHGSENGDGGACGDWDDSGSEADVAGIAPGEEIREARGLLVTILRTHFAGDGDAFLNEVWPTEREGVRFLLGVCCRSFE
ncbi:hypothetical protein DQ04_07211000 [Trypanosoma grayi]|uniref:hypothetical protein n=1 Tax=Trypanosoma grayi TaxID=71804 RepID=UPI0004F424F1|nr:hypothetical protein DQ04_07211000 [Trypanosoma grayi]KEG08425.1 hypothetical protein DQ04_07211000 [Trypanosoma grayi]